MKGDCQALLYRLLTIELHEHDRAALDPRLMPPGAEAKIGGLGATDAETWHPAAYTIFYPVLVRIKKHPAISLRSRGAFCVRCWAWTGGQLGLLIENNF